MAASEELIGEIHKISEILKSSDSNWDVIEITQLLKSLGLQLDSVDFETAVAPNEGTAPHLSVEIRCGTSKIVSRLTSTVKRECICPKYSNNSSFWEVQGIAPSANGVENGNTKEKSSNLLPEISKNTNDCVKTLLDAALHLFKTPATVPTTTDLVDLHSNKENSVPAVKIEPAAEENLNTSSSTQIISPSPKDEVFFANMRADNDRDIRIIQQLSEARYKIDQALLMLKFNGRSDMLHNSLLMNTPQKPSACSSPRVSSARKHPYRRDDIQGIVVNKIENKKTSAKLSLLPPRDEKILKRRSVGSISEQFVRREPLLPRALPQAPAAPSAAAGVKKKVAVKENITSNLRRSMKLSQSMPKLPSSATKK
ncbi:uncharacterized protein LOC129794639 [Lutzomyia longipalpis]|uniref:uncharacterized protein LOC129794639 n=1 Tax=Lutzomyia longipalpis TaxID=7200 RepID=UPI0024840694|nr:uncharacterized protein LOC129794639 [Lutzomyia longipalpis]